MSGGAAGGGAAGGAAGSGGAGNGRRPKRMIASSTGRILAVFDTAGEADAAVAALASMPGTDPGRFERYDRPEDAPAFDSSGRRRGLRGRLFRILEFSWADQAPDYAWYEAAVREGHVVLSVPARGQATMRAVADILAAHGAHFINHYGWFETQELVRWRGPEPDLPGFLRR